MKCARRRQRLHIHPTAGVSNVLSRFSFCVLLKNLPDAGESHRQPLFSERTGTCGAGVFTEPVAGERRSRVTALYLGVSSHLYRQILICTERFGRFLKSDLLLVLASRRVGPAKARVVIFLL